MGTGTYELYVECVNCGFNDLLKITKGTPVENAECPDCGCSMLIKEKISMEKIP